MFEKITKKLKQLKKASKEKFLCSKYRNNGASNGECMGFSSNWCDTDDMCKKCTNYFENK